MLDLDKVKNFTEDKRRSRFLCLLYAHLLLLFVLSVSRMIFHGVFNETSISLSEIFPVYLYGIIFDLGPYF